jgi:hypothetical protein
MYSGMVTLTFGGSDWLSTYDVYMGATPTTFIWDATPTTFIWDATHTTILWDTTPTTILWGH